MTLNELIDAWKEAERKAEETRAPVDVAEAKRLHWALVDARRDLEKRGRK